MDTEIYDRLFLRQQVAAITGIDSSTLNYWMREGVLRAARGGSGRGSHRLFPYHQVTLAAVLKTLHDFGISTITLAKLAERFHLSFDWLSQQGIDRNNINRIFEAYLIRKSIVENGFWDWRIETSAEETAFAGLPFHTDRYGHVNIHLNWEQAVEYWYEKRPYYRPTDAELTLVGSWNTPEHIENFSECWQYFTAITSIDLREHDEEISSSPEYFYRNEQGELVMTPDEAEAQRSIGFIGIDIERLANQLWRRWASTAKEGG